MHLITRNVNTAFYELVSSFHAGSKDPNSNIVKRTSRNGPVLMREDPVMVTYTHPKERVLFNQARDANPFLHLYEALWMLAGRNDVAPLAYYAKQFERYSDDGKTLNGAYGNRWRHAKGELIHGPFEKHGVEADWENVDQLRILIDHLKADPNSRRAVLQMWYVEDDLLKIGTSKDVCCNTAVYFSIRTVHFGPALSMRGPHIPSKDISYLDMTVTNRSNDMIWGMLGGDFTTFSFLQEYMAAQIGVEVGRYTQMTNNLHVYENNWKPDEWLKWYESTEEWDSQLSRDGDYSFVTKSIPLIKDPAKFDEELPKFVETYSGDNPERKTWVDYSEPFFDKVAQPMMTAFYAYKKKSYDLALSYCKDIIADDWRIAATNWIARRAKRNKR